MSDYHCLDIEFSNVNFNEYRYPNIKAKIKKIHHAHLYTQKDKIELRILFDEKTGFGDSLMLWTSKIDWRKFGSYIKIELTKNYTNERLQKIDLSDAKLIGITNSSNFYEDSKKYIIVRIDTVKFYWNPVESEKNKGSTFYFSLPF